jgi:hypothetical protein
MRSALPRKVQPVGRRERTWRPPVAAFVGLAALVWFCLRVIPRPSRVRYPCQRAALPIASAFLAWLLGALGLARSLRAARRRLAAASPLVTLGAACGTLVAVAAAVGFAGRAPTLADVGVRNEPIGVGCGLHPGRVAWVHDPDATDWVGPISREVWFEHTSFPVVERMLSQGIRALAGEADDHAAWDALFRHANRTHGKGDVGYTPGEKIVVKVNMTLSGGFGRGSDKPWQYLHCIDNSPQLTVALLKQLVDVVGARPPDIAVGDPSRLVPAYYHSIVSSTEGLGDVVYLSRRAPQGSGRTPARYSNVPVHWSDPDPKRLAEGMQPDHVPTHYAEADYLVNFAILKSHDDSGVTLCAKNHYGSLIRDPVAWGRRGARWYNMHLTRARELPAMGQYRCLVDLMGHPDIGGKTVLYMVDGLFGGRGWAARPVKWRMDPFDGDWPNSIFLSQDPVAVDSVCFDFLYAEWTGFPRMAGADDYLHEAALAHDPPSGTFYDPDGDGQRLQSLGVHEHWNDPQHKQYSRNLGAAEGVELIAVHEAPAAIAEPAETQTNVEQ